MVLIGILRATHIQTKNKQIDDNNDDDEEAEWKKKFSIDVTPRTHCFNETHYSLMVVYASR